MTKRSSKFLHLRSWNLHIFYIFLLEKQLIWLNDYQKPLDIVRFVFWFPSDVWRLCESTSHDIRRNFAVSVADTVRTHRAQTYSALQSAFRSQRAKCSVRTHTVGVETHTYTNTHSKSRMRVSKSLPQNSCFRGLFLLSAAMFHHSARVCICVCVCAPVFFFFCHLRSETVWKCVYRVSLGMLFS